MIGKAIFLKMHNFELLELKPQVNIHKNGLKQYI